MTMTSTAPARDVGALIRQAFEAAADPREYGDILYDAYQETGDWETAVEVADRLTGPEYESPEEEEHYDPSDWVVEADSRAPEGRRWRNVHNPKLVTYQQPGLAGAGTPVPVPWGRLADHSPPGAGTPVPTPARYAAEDWVEEQAPRAKSGKRWRNTKTGTVSYEDPTGGQEGAGEATASSPETPRHPSAAASVPRSSEELASAFFDALQAARTGTEEEFGERLRAPVAGALAVLGAARASEITREVTGKARAATADFLSGGWRVRVSEFVAARAIDFASDSVFSLCINSLGQDALGVSPTMAASVLTSSAVAAVVVKARRKLASTFGQAATQHAADDGSELYIASGAVERYLASIASILGVEPPGDVEDRLAVRLCEDTDRGPRHYVKTSALEDSLHLALRYLRAGGDGDAADCVRWGMQNEPLLDDEPDIEVEGGASPEELRYLRQEIGRARASRYARRHGIALPAVQGQAPSMDTARARPAAPEPARPSEADEERFQPLLAAMAEQAAAVAKLAEAVATSQAQPAPAPSTALVEQVAGLALALSKVVEASLVRQARPRRVTKEVVIERNEDGDMTKAIQTEIDVEVEDDGEGDPVDQQPQGA